MNKKKKVTVKIIHRKLKEINPFLLTRPPVSLASALSLAAHAHYVNGMVSGGGSGRVGNGDGHPVHHVNHHQAAALHAAVAAAAAASAAAARRAENERGDEVEQDRGACHYTARPRLYTVTNVKFDSIQHRQPRGIGA